MEPHDPPVLLFYVDGEESSGAGHLRRCEGLASAACERGWKCLFLDTGPGAAAWLRERGWEVVADEAACTGVSAAVIDSYLISCERLSSLKERYARLVGFHDGGTIDSAFSLIISTAEKIPDHPMGAHVFSGTMYRIIHPDIISAPKAHVPSEVATIVVTFGAAPAISSFSSVVAARIREEFPSATVRIIAGLSGADAAHAFSEADIAVSGGGQGMLELAYLGVPTVAVILSDDQIGQVRDAASRGAVLRAGTREDADIADKIVKAVHDLYSVQMRDQLSRAAISYLDGRGAERILDVIPII